MILFLLTFSGSAQASPARTPLLHHDGHSTVKAFSQKLHLFIAPTPRPKKDAEIKQVISAVKAVAYRFKKMSDKRILRIAKAALKASRRYGVDAIMLIAIARMESDFVSSQDIPRSCHTKKTCWAGCGITQHYIVGPSRWVLRRCQQIAHNYSLAFMGSAKEVAHHVRWCQKRKKHHKPLRRCVLNRYNSGTFYRTKWRCRRRFQRCLKMVPKLSWVREAGLLPAAQQYRKRIYRERKGRCWRSRNFCFRRAAYWKTVMCFDYGARNGLRSKISCRRMGRCVGRWCRRRLDLQDIPTKFYSAK